MARNPLFLVSCVYLAITISPMRTPVLCARSAFLCVMISSFVGCASKTKPLAEKSLPSVSEACTVLQNFKGEYSYGGWGDGAESNDGEVAAWTISCSPDAVQRLVDMFPHCMPSGQAYALAVLCRLDKSAFQSLTNAFCRPSEDIHVASGCIGWTEKRTELVIQMQRSKSVL